jgi:hypothetical protein
MPADDWEKKKVVGVLNDVQIRNVDDDENGDMKSMNVGRRCTPLNVYSISQFVPNLHLMSPVGL